jgi:hypothetical protein
MEGKELLLNLLSTSTSSKEEASNSQSLLYENETIKKILDRIKDDPKYLFSFINDISDSLLNKILASIEPITAEEPFKKSILFIKGLITTYKEASLELNLNISQREDLYKLEALMEKTIANNKVKLDLLSKANMSGEDVEIIKRKLDNGEVITSADYDTIEKIVKSLVPTNQDITWDKIVTFLNDYNSTKLKTLTSEKAPIENAKEEIKITNIFEPHSITLETKKEQEETRKNSLASYEHRQKVKEIMVSLGYNLDEMDEFSQSRLLSISNLSKLEDYTKALIKTGFTKYLKTTNIRGLVIILTESNIELLSKEIKMLVEEYHLDDKDIKILISCAINIFTVNGYNNFLQNIQILNKYGVSLRTMIYKCPSFLADSSFDHKTNIELLEKAGLNVKDIIMKCYPKLGSKFDELFNNIEALNGYGYGLTSLNDKSVSILAGNKLSRVLDEFIELGLNDYLAGDNINSSEAIKTLALKRVFYAYKNTLPVWNFLGTSSGSFREENQEYNEIINKKRRTLKIEDINKLVSNYPTVASLEAGRRPIVDSSHLSLVKNTTEYHFDNKIISRPKALSDFMVLVGDNIPEREALLYSLSDKSSLNDSEYTSLKNAVYGHSIGAKVA